MNFEILMLKTKDIINHQYFHRFIILAILINSIVLGLQTFPLAKTYCGKYLPVIDKVCLMVFIAELGLRVFADRDQFFKNGWNLFDMVVIGLSSIASIGNLTVLRGFRVIRVLHLISEFPILEKVVKGMILSLPGVGAAITLLLIIFYMASVMATTYFGQNFPDLFGTIGASTYTLFQVMTLESWSMGVVRPVMEVFPYAWMFFIPFIMTTTYIILNLFVGIIGHAIDSVEKHHNKKGSDEQSLEDISKRLESIERCLQQKIRRRRSTED
jgi:voltage-gated sodium channel